MVGTEHHRLDSDRSFKYLMVLALFSALIYLVNRWLIIPLPQAPAFFTNYLGDVLALPVYLPLSFYLAVKLNIIPKDFRFGLSHILVAVLIFSVIFEGIIPYIDESLTRDPFDILAYLAGGLLVVGVSTIAGRVKT